MKILFPRRVQTCLLSIVLIISSFALRAAETIDANRIRDIAALLPAQPAGFAWPISDRANWQKLAASPAFASTIATANKLLAKPLADVPDSLFLELKSVADA